MMAIGVVAVLLVAAAAGSHAAPVRGAGQPPCYGDLGTSYRGVDVGYGGGSAFSSSEWAAAGSALGTVSAPHVAVGEDAPRQAVLTRMICPPTAHHSRWNFTQPWLRMRYDVFSWTLADNSYTGKLPSPQLRRVD